MLRHQEHSPAAAVDLDLMNSGLNPGSVRYGLEWEHTLRYGIAGAPSRSSRDLGCLWVAGRERGANTWIPLLSPKPAVLPGEGPPWPPCSGQHVAEAVKGQEPAVDSLKCLETGLRDVFPIKVF